MWVAVYREERVAAADSEDEVLAMVEDQGLPVRFVAITNVESVATPELHK